MKIFSKLLITLTIGTLFQTFIAPEAFAEKMSGQIFSLDADVQKDAPLDQYSREETTADGITKVHTVYSSPDGKEAVTEDLELKGVTLVSYKVSQKQVGEEGSVVVKDKKVFFSYKKKDHEPKDAEENYVENLTVPPAIVPYIQKHWADIKADKKLTIRLAVPERRETVGFDLFRDKSSTDAKTIVKMKASSLVISAIVDPLYFTFLPDGSRMTEMRGRTAVKIEKDGKFVDQDAHTVYKFE